MAVLPPKKDYDPERDALVLPKFKHLLSGPNLLPPRAKPAAPAEPVRAAETVDEVMARIPALANKRRGRRAAEPEPEPETPRYAPRNRK